MHFLIQMYLEAGVFFCVLISVDDARKTMKKVDERCLAPSRSRSESIADTLRKAPILISGQKKKHGLKKLPVE